MMEKLRSRQNKNHFAGVALGLTAFAWMGILNGCSTSKPAPRSAAQAAPAAAMPPEASKGPKWHLQATDFPDFTSWIGPETVVDSGIVNVIVAPKVAGWKDVQGQFGFGSFPMIKLDDGRYQAVVAIPIDWLPGDQFIGLKWTQNGEQKSARIPFKTVAMTYRFETLSVAPKTVEPPKKDLPRILREQKELGAAYRNTVDQKLWEGGFIKPVESEPTSSFGSRRVYNGIKNSPHLGLDLRAKIGTPVKAASGGRVVFSADTYFGGNTVVLDHGYSLFTIYAHLSKLKVKVGTTVKRGQEIALSGATGRVTGPHLHWGVQIHGVKVNPEHLLGLE